MNANDVENAIIKHIENLEYIAKVLERRHPDFAAILRKTGEVMRIQQSTLTTLKQIIKDSPREEAK